MSNVPDGQITLAAWVDTVGCEQCYERWLSKTEREEGEKQ